MFVTYEIPSGTPQYFAALRWVYDQPAVRRASRRLVVNPIGTPLAAADGADSHAPSSAPDDPEDPLELGLHTVPMLLRDQSLCARVGSSLVWVGRGGGAHPHYHEGGVNVDGPGLGAMGGGGARGSWYQQLLSGTRGHAGLAHASAFGWEGDMSGGASGAGGAIGTTGAAGALRLTVMGLDGEETVRRILASGHRLGRGTARRFTRVYLPSAVVRTHGRGDGKHAWTRPEWVDAGSKPARPISSVILKGDAGADVLADARAFLGLERWYAERGIPYRRGYLLHGPPGSGKTSLVCAVAGELRLPIYQLRLSGAGLDDEAFQRLLAATSRRAVVLLEDVDAARGAAVGSRTGEAMNRARPSPGGVGRRGKRTTGQLRERVRRGSDAARPAQRPRRRRRRGRSFALHDVPPRFIAGARAGSTGSDRREGRLRPARQGASRRALPTLLPRADATDGDAVHRTAGR